MRSLFLTAILTPPLLFIISGQIILTGANIAAFMLISGLAVSVAVAIAALSKAVK